MDDNINCMNKLLSKKLLSRLEGCGGSAKLSGDGRCRFVVPRQKSSYSWDNSQKRGRSRFAVPRLGAAILSVFVMLQPAAGARDGRSVGKNEVERSDSPGALLDSRQIHQGGVTQGTILSGKVVDTDGAPVIGAGIISMQNKAAGTTTDLDGKFSFKVPAGTESVLFSSVGMKDVVYRITPGKTEDITIVMEWESTQLDQVVVTGYAQTTVKG